MPLFSRSLLLSISVIFLNTDLLAAGLSFGQNGASPHGPASIYYNPAAITQLPGTQLTIGTMIGKSNVRFQSSTTSESVNTVGGTQVIPHFYLTHRIESLGEKNVTFGIGLYHPFGGGKEYPEGWQGRFTSMKGELWTTVVNPMVAFNATSKLSLAAGLQIADTRATTRQQFRMLPLISESTIAGEEVSGQALGWKAGLNYQFNDKVSARFHYTSPLNTPLSGNVHFTGPGASYFVDTKVHANLYLPEMAFAGLSIRLSPQWSIGGEINWQNWSSSKALPRYFENTANSALPQSSFDTPGTLHWRDAYAYSIGFVYRATQQFTFCGGLRYSDSAIPNEYISPSFIDTPSRSFMIGMSYHISKKYTVDFSYAKSFYQTANITTSTQDPNNLRASTALGSYSPTMHAIQIGFTTRF